MKTFEVKFEIFGKKLKTKVQAEDREHAKKKIKDKIIFHEIKDIDNIDFLKNLFGIK